MLKKLRSKSAKSAAGTMAVLVYLCLTIGHSTPIRTDRDRPPSVALITESIHLTAGDGVKSLAQLLHEQSSVILPDQAISRLTFLVDAGHGALTFPTNDFQPAGFEFSIRAGDSKTIQLPRMPVNAAQALQFSLARSAGVTNFILTVEFYPAVEK